MMGLNHNGWVLLNRYVSQLRQYKHIKEEAGLFSFKDQTRLPAAALQCLGLIQDHVLPFDPLEVFHVLDHQLVAGDHHVEGGVLRVQRFLLKSGQKLKESVGGCRIGQLMKTNFTWLQNLRITLRS